MIGKPASQEPEDLFIFHHMHGYYSFNGQAYLGCLVDCGASGRAAQLFVGLEDSRRPFATTHGVRFFWLDPLLKLSATATRRADPHPFCTRRTCHKPGLLGVIKQLQEWHEAPVCPDLFGGALDETKQALTLATIKAFYPDQTTPVNTASRPGLARQPAGTGPIILGQGEGS